MTNLTTISNATFDTAASAVPGPYGPLTRSTNYTAYPQNNLDATTKIVPNTRIPIFVTGQGSKTFFITYEQMVNPGVRDDVLAEAYGQQSLNNNLKTFIRVLYQFANSMNIMTATSEDYSSLMRLFQYFKPIIAMAPAFDWTEITNANKLVASYSVSGTGASRTFLNTSTGYELDSTKWFWDFGDGTSSQLENPPVKTWAADGSYPVTLYAGGRGGFSIYTTTLVIDVP